MSDPGPLTGRVALVTGATSPSVDVVVNGAGIIVRADAVGHRQSVRGGAGVSGCLGRGRRT